MLPKREHVDAAAEGLARSIYMIAIQRLIALIAVPVFIAFLSWTAGKFNEMQIDMAVIKFKVDAQYAEVRAKNDAQDKQISQILDFIYLNANSRMHGSPQ